MAYKVSYRGSLGVPKAPGGSVARIAPPVVQFGPEGAKLSDRRGNPSHRDPQDWYLKTTPGSPL